ncbi:hypothetical protein DPMN_153002 [Dreissena polymorpha]|uniref:Uncharacterized protein n=1 Tax=Dreissena polymorpha TaxID=45954 RepID=A0A9D4FKN0_DREPO|nr:hypothetical protein DPMN_153002 [Dreissena polymorpha]
MDRLPSGGGMPGGAGADGAFERFLTAAIATIITIMFSWRLLGEEDEASGRNSGSVGARAIRNKSPHKHYGEESRSTVSPANRPNLSASSAGICDIDISDDEHNTHRSCEVSKSTLPDIDQPVEREVIVHDQQIPMYAQQQPRGGCEQPTSDENVSSVSIPDDNMTVDTLTSWDEYKWEEETGIEHDDVIVTRRTVRDFVSNRSPKSSYDHSDSGDNSLDHMSGVNVNIEVTNHNQSQSVPFSQRFANFEYKDTGGDSGYIDLYPDSDSDRMDSSDEEDEYEIQVSDSDSDEEDASAGSFYGVTTLDTIMEEIEMDASDDVIIALDKRSSNRQDVDSAYISSICDEDDNTMETNKCDNSVQGVRDARAIECLANNNGVVCEQNNSPDFVNSSRVNGNDGSENSRVTATDFLTTENTMTQSVQNELHLKPNHANTVECNLTLENLPKSDMKNTSADLQQVCDMNINQTGTVSDYLALNEIRNATADPSVISNDKQVVNKITTIKVANSSYKPNKMKLKLTEDESKISDLSDDSLPPSPVRTCALDNLADAFSDTESCSSESVIRCLA